MEQQISAIRDQADRQVQQIRARADQAVTEVEERAEEAVRQHQLTLFRQLRPLQEAHARAGRLDEALAIRDRLRTLRATLLQAQPDPGNLGHLREAQPGTSLLFEVTGSADGVVWGTDIYTGDSTLAVAAVHAGLLAVGERGVVRVTLVDTLNVTFTGSERNGVWSEDFSSWPIGYRLQRA
ncbi:MAG: LCCL domain-containing protein [Gemmataceae bacterium]